jgi:hypothetical protein
VQRTGKGCNEEKKTQKTKTSRFKAFVFAAVAAQGGGTFEVRLLRMYSVHPSPIFLSTIVDAEMLPSNSGDLLIFDRSSDSGAWKLDRIAACSNNINDCDHR